MGSLVAGWDQGGAPAGPPCPILSLGLRLPGFYGLKSWKLEISELLLVPAGG